LLKSLGFLAAVEMAEYASLKAQRLGILARAHAIFASDHAYVNARAGQGRGECALFHQG
jgi:hypothetical protein